MQQCCNGHNVTLIFHPIEAKIAFVFTKRFRQHLCNKQLLNSVLIGYIELLRPRFVKFYYFFLFLLDFGCKRLHYEQVPPIDEPFVFSSVRYDVIMSYNFQYTIKLRHTIVYMFSIFDQITSQCRIRVFNIRLNYVIKMTFYPQFLTYQNSCIIFNKSIKPIIFVLE